MNQKCARRSPNRPWPSSLERDKAPATWPRVVIRVLNSHRRFYIENYVCAFFSYLPRRCDPSRDAVSPLDVFSLVHSSLSLFRSLTPLDHSACECECVCSRPFTLPLFRSLSLPNGFFSLFSGPFWYPDRSAGRRLTLFQRSDQCTTSAREVNKNCCCVIFNRFSNKTKDSPSDFFKVIFM